MIVGCDRDQEWLLPWWWRHYSAHNSYPVLFVDLGLSSKARVWCQKRGDCVALPPKVCPIQELSPQEHARFAPYFGEGVWLYREAVFKKSFACLLSPFAHSCWIDVDCEVRGPLAPLFSLLHLGAEIGLVREPAESSYNSGVIPFRKNSPILRQWADLCLTENHRFLTDQEALSHAIEQHRPAFLELPAIYNWKRSSGPNEEALILHYASGYWKEQLRLQM